MTQSKVKTTTRTRGFLEWAVLRPLAWKAAGVRDAVNNRKANKGRDIVR